MIKTIVFTEPVLANANSSYLFAQLEHLKTIENANLLDMSQVIDMSYLFYDSSLLLNVDLTSWQTSQVTTMANLFSGAKNMTELGIANWDVSQVTDMSSMFKETISLQKLDLNQWDTGNVTNMAEMFFESKNLKTLEISQWNTSQVIDMSVIFSGINNLKTVEIDQWNTGNVESMADMFNSSSFETLNLNQWDTSKVVSMQGMFNRSSLRNLDIKDWDISKVKSMYLMFCSSLHLADLNIENWDTGNVKYMDSIFIDTSLRRFTLGKYSLFQNAKFVSNDNEAYVLESGENRYSTSYELFRKYDGSEPGTYIQEKYYQAVIPVTSITLSPSSLALVTGESSQLQATITPSKATNQKVTYTSSNPAIASVSADGKVSGLSAGQAVITVETEDGGFQASTEVTVKAPNVSQFVLNPFYLGIDEYVTGSVDTSLNAKKVQLVINGEVISTDTIAKTGSFELDTQGKITSPNDQVKVLVLDRKNVVLDQALVAIEVKNYSLTVNPYTLYEQQTITGQADLFHTHLALVVNGEEVVRQLVTLDRSFSFDVSDWVEYEDDEVEIVGYRYEQEITRSSVTILEPSIDLETIPYKVGDPYLSGKVTGSLAYKVRLYVNYGRQQEVVLGSDGRFNFLGVVITSPLDVVEIAVYDGAGVEVQRFNVTVQM